MKNLRCTNPAGVFFAVLLFLGMLSCGEQAREKMAGEEQKPVDPPEQIISVEQAQGMYRNYSERRAPMIEHYEDSISPESKFDVARYVYYDFETIKQYLAYIEEQAEIAEVDVSTLRFYFSNYPDQKTFSDGRPVLHPRQNSIFIIPTVKVDTVDYGFYLQQNAEGKWVPALLNGQMQPHKANGMGLIGTAETRNYAGFVPLPGTAGPPALFQDSRSTILNEGGSAPPPHK